MSIRKRASLSGLKKQLATRSSLPTQFRISVSQQVTKRFHQGKKDFRERTTLSPLFTAPGHCHSPTVRSTTSPSAVKRLSITLNYEWSEQILFKQTSARFRRSLRKSNSTIPRLKI